MLKSMTDNRISSVLSLHADRLFSTNVVKKNNYLKEIGLPPSLFRLIRPLSCFPFNYLNETDVFPCCMPQCG